MNASNHAHLTRRQTLALGLAGAVAIATSETERASGSPTRAAGESPMRRARDSRTGTLGTRMPVVFLPHGGGPWPFVDLGLDPAEVHGLASYLRGVAASPSAPPKGLLVVSAHWEAEVPTLMTAEHPPMLYDYFGFPDAAYRIAWPAPGAPALARRVKALLEQAGISASTDPTRGFDHGTFVPLKLAYPEPTIPTTQLSLQIGLDPARHLAIGAALRALRDEGIFIVASGMTYHNLRAFFDKRPNDDSERFDTWLRHAMALEPNLRARALMEWTAAPAARLAHPREEHLLPLMVAVGAAGDDPASVAFGGTMMGKRLAAFQFG